MFSLKNAGALGALALGVSMVAGAAQAKPDLVVNVERSQILSTSCRTSEPLARVRVAVDNIGETSAARGTSIGLPSVAAVAAEHAPFTVETVSSRNNIDPGEIATVVVTIGEGTLKAGRIGRSLDGGSVVAVATSQAEQRRLSRGLRVDIQRALKREGYYTDVVDAVFGPNTVRAIREYQRSRGEAQTGVLTLAQIDELLGDSERSPESGSGEARSVRLVIIVDPENLVDESDEENNTWITEPLVLGNC